MSRLNSAEYISKQQYIQNCTDTGLNRQIRRMCQELGYKVEKLTRIRVMNIELGDLVCGEYRVVEGAEKEKLYNSL